MSRLQEVLGPGHEACYIRKTLNDPHIQTPEVLGRATKNIQASRDAQATSEQSTSEQSLEHRGPRSTSNRRASKAFP